MRKKPSFLFAPYKSLGVHTTAVRPAIFYNSHKKKPYVSIYCPISNTLAEYNGTKLRLISVSDCLPADITAVAVNSRDSRHGIYVAAGEAIYCLTFCRKVDRVIKLKCKVKFMIVLGENLIIVDFDNGLRVVNIESGDESLHLEGDDSFVVTSLLHPATYINKVVLGSSKGSLRIVNVRSGKVVHQFTKLGDSSIDVLEQSPVFDVLALGCGNGDVILHNIRTDERILSFRHDKAISAIGFRNDGAPTMTTADVGGNLAVWDLEKQELAGKITKVHTGPVTQLYFVTGEPIMISTSADNSMRVWVLDAADGMPRQLNILEGHAAAASAVEFCTKTEVVTASLDGSIRKHSIAFNGMREKLGDAGVMSRADAKKKKRDLGTIKMDPVVNISIGFSREAAWDNILCRHLDSLPVSTWTTRKKTMGKHKLVHPRFTENSALFHATATATCISPCGNFAFIGYSTGHLDQFNIQSGRLIKSFGEVVKMNDSGVEEKSGKAHTAAVTALAVDARGNELVSGSSAGELRFWDIRKGSCSATMKTRLRIEGCAQSPVSNLLAAVCTGEGKEGASVTIIDTLCRRVVRTFKEVGDVLKCITFSSDGKWLLTADNSSYVRVWELSTSHLIDVMLFEKPCIGLAFNETGQFLATIHEGEKAIEIWANKKLFAPQLNIKALAVTYRPKWEDNLEDFTDYDPLEELSEEEDMEDENEMDPELISFSGLPPSRWLNLAELSLIKERNKPTQPVRKPKQAPFFLTASSTLEGFEFDVPKEEDENEQRKALQAKRSLLEIESSFSSSLRRASSKEELLAVFEQLKRMSLSAIDFQLRSLPIDVLSQFFKMLLEVIKSRSDFELAQSYMSAAIRIHRSVLWNSEDDELSSVLEKLSLEVDEAWSPLDDLLNDNAAVVQWVKNALL